MSTEKLKESIEYNINRAVQAGVNPVEAVSAAALQVANVALKGGMHPFLITGILDSVKHGVNKTSYEKVDQNKSLVHPAGVNELPKPPQLNGGRG